MWQIYTKSFLIYNFINNTPNISVKYTKHRPYPFSYNCEHYIFQEESNINKIMKDNVIIVLYCIIYFFFYTKVQKITKYITIIFINILELIENYINNIYHKK